MLKRYHHTAGTLFRIVDAAVVAAAWIISYWLRFYAPLVEVTKGFPSFSQYAALTPLVVILWWITFSSQRLYQSQRMLRRTQEALHVLRAHFIALLYFVTLTSLFSEYRYSRVVLIFFGLIGGISLITTRLIIRNSLRSLRKKGYNLRHALAIGYGPALEEMLFKLRRFPELGVSVRGVLIPSVEMKSSPEGNIQTIQQTPILGPFEALEQELKREKVDQLLIALPRHYAKDLESILNSLKDETLDIQLIPDLHEFTTLGCTVEDFDGLPLIRMNDSPLSGFGIFLKRVTDFILSFLGLIFLSPLLLFIASLIKLTSKGPIFYGQERMGLDGRTFKMWKFRSMKVDAEKETGAVWARKEDQRRTPIGTFLRMTSIDELPQLWNVFIGDMALVGPRPERPVFVEKFRGEIPHYMLRHKVKAGITGWAQVNGWRGDTSLERRIECDLYYIRNWSYTLDIKILWLTLWKGFVHKNAY
jgi:Undecaprenyl-phosphate glucose phosphotransferase